MKNCVSVLVSSGDGDGRAGRQEVWRGHALTYYGRETRSLSDGGRSVEDRQGRVRGCSGSGGSAARSGSNVNKSGQPHCRARAVSRVSHRPLACCLVIDQHRWDSPYAS